jgi:hypothetical protein
MPRDDRLLPITWALLLPPGALALVFGLLLFIFPNRTDTLFSWTITPAMSAVYVGASYAFGGIATLGLLFGRKWHPLGTLLLGTWVFSVGLLVATVLHWNRFHLGTAQFYVWFIIYVVLPFGLPVAYWLNRGYDPGPSPADVRLDQPVRIGMGVLGILYIVFGLAMFLLPGVFAAIWPWDLTALMSRVIGSWYLLPGVAALSAFWETRWSAFRPATRAVAIWPALLLIGSLLHNSDFFFDRISTWIWFPYLAISFLGVIGVFVYYERKQTRAAPVPGPSPEAA